MSFVHQKPESYQSQYAEILWKLINHPDKQRSSRIGNTRSRFVEIIRVDLKKEFPLMDIKKIQFNNILHELLWFIKGDTNIKYLVDNQCNIWNDDSFRYYKEKYKSKDNNPANTVEEFIEKVRNGDYFYYNEDYMMNKYCYGDMDRIYSSQWRNFNGKTDQLQNCVNTLLKNPDDRRMIVSAHNPTDIEDNIVGLPSCHNIFQFYTIPLTFQERLKIKEEKHPIDTQDLDTEEKLDRYKIPKFKLNLWFNIRSNDYFLGQSYNMPSYATLCHIISNIVNMIPNEIVCTAIDCHLYEAHVPAAEEWLNRFRKIIEDNYIGETGVEENVSDVTFCKSKLNIKRKLTSIDDLKFEDLELTNYNPDSFIKAPLLT